MCIRDSANSLIAFAQRGEALRRKVERLELVRRTFSRPLELWLALDMALFLQETGDYQTVRLQRLCDRTVTPRNVAVVALRGRGG